MKQFFKIMFASMLGIMLSVGLAIFVFFLIIMASTSSKKEEPKISNNSILHIELENQIKDRPSDNFFDNIDFASFEDKTALSLRSIIKSIHTAKIDERIKGIYLDIPSLEANLASTEEIRKALSDFKESGKFIVSYSEDYSQNEYHLSSVADEIYLNPGGDLTFKGLSAQLMFFKDALDRLDIEMQVIRHGKFKSAIEPFILNEMSSANEEQMKILINSIWNAQLDAISTDRKLDKNELNRIADGLLIRTAINAKELGLVDDLKYEDEVLAILASKVNEEKTDKINFVTLNQIKNVRLKADTINGIAEKFNSKNNIAIIYAEGEIVSGESENDQLGSITLAKAIKEARKDSKVKAIVLRVNSPGGSALASDVMWREVKLAKAEKPFIVSMGDVAASGGYYIACAADKIFAESSTITGSIGVFGLIPNIEGMLDKKLGIHVDRVNSNTYSDGLTLLRPMHEKEKEAVQESVEKIYADFTMKVAEGRNMEQSQVDSIGQGRVWTGVKALEVGLVDQIGGLSDAIAEAARMAEITDYKLKELPAKEDPFEKILKDISESAKMKLFGTEFGLAEKYYSNFKQVIHAKGIYTRLPIDIIID